MYVNNTCEDALTFSIKDDLSNFRNYSSLYPSIFKNYTYTYKIDKQGISKSKFSQLTLAQAIIYPSNFSQFIDVQNYKQKINTPLIMNESKTDQQYNQPKFINRKITSQGKNIVRKIIKYKTIKKYKTYYLSNYNNNNNVSLYKFYKRIFKKDYNELVEENDQLKDQIHNLTMEICSLKNDFSDIHIKNRRLKNENIELQNLYQRIENYNSQVQYKNEQLQKKYDYISTQNNCKKIFDTFIQQQMEQEKQEKENNNLSKCFKTIIFVKWRWRGDYYTKDWMDYSYNQQVVLEQAFLAWIHVCIGKLKDKNILFIKPCPLVWMEINNMSYELDVVNLIQKNVVTKNTRTITRSIEYIQVPIQPNCNLTNLENYMTVDTLDEKISDYEKVMDVVKLATLQKMPYLLSNNLYELNMINCINNVDIPFRLIPIVGEEIYKLFYESFDSRPSMLQRNATIVAVHKIVYPIKWKQFNLQSSIMDYKQSHLYFHGTHATNPLVVIADGADPRESKRDQMYLGKGFYTTPSVSYIHEGNYAHRLSNGNYQILAVQCLLGRCYKTNMSSPERLHWTRPPLYKDNVHYDSTCSFAEQDTPIFAIYLPQQLYVSYLIEYKL